MSATFDTLRATRDVDSTGTDRKAGEAGAEAARAGHGERATGGDHAATRSDIAALRWVVGGNVAINLATLGGVLAVAFR